MLKKLLLLSTYLLCITLSMTAQDFMMQAWYWDYPKDGCGDYVGDNWATTLDAKAAELGTAGFTYLWLPPASRASFGECSNGYDPKDLYDWGEFGLGRTGLGTRTEVDALITKLNANGIDAVADVVYNHRDGGAWEDNPPVENWVDNYQTSFGAPFPSDRFRYVLPLGGMSGNGAGEYYIKISSSSGHGDFNGSNYIFYAQTNTVGFQGLAQMTETEPNGGGDCGQAFDAASLGVDYLSVMETGTSCGTDEFQIILNPGDFDPNGDELMIFMRNVNGGYADQRIYGLFSIPEGEIEGEHIVNQVRVQTATNFEDMPSDAGAMNYRNFRPNSLDVNTTSLSGDQEGMFFFYDVVQEYAGGPAMNEISTKDAYFDWTEWLWDDVGIRGLRMDAVKHFNGSFVGDLLDHMHDLGKDPGLVVGEFFDAGTGVLEGWINSVTAAMDADTKAAIQPKVFDFALRENIRAACDDFGKDARDIFGASLVDATALTGFNVVTFVNNHDFRDGNCSLVPAEPSPNEGFDDLVRNTPILGYAYILTNNQLGVPSVYYPDYYGYPALPPDQNCGPDPHDYYPLDKSPLKTQIDELMAAHQMYIVGSTSVDYLSNLGTPRTQVFTSGFDNTTLFYQLSGSTTTNKNILVAINFAAEPLIVQHGINMTTGLTIGETLFEVAGDGTDMTINGDGTVDISIPARSYAVWVDDLTILSLEWLNFSATPKQKSVQLNWEIARSNDVEGFDIEKSDNGKDFYKIAWMDYANQQQLDYVDTKVAAGQTIYYRLKAMDKSGKEHYSTIETVKLMTDQPIIKISPNPANNRLNISIESPITNAIKLKVFNSVGEMVLEEKLERSNTSLLVNHLPAGIYWLEITINGLKQIEKIVVE